MSTDIRTTELGEFATGEISTPISKSINESNSPISANSNSEQLNSEPPKSKRGGRREGAGRPKKSKEFVPPSVPDQIARIQKILDTNPGAREAAPLVRQLAQLTGASKTYLRTVAEREERDKKLTQPEKPKPIREALCWRRAGLIEQVANRFLEPYNDLPDPYALELSLTQDEIEAAAQVEFTPEQLLMFTKEFIWDQSHKDEVREIQQSFVEDMAVPSPEFDELQMAVKTNQPGSQGSHVRWLIAFPKVFVNAGPVLNPDELRKVEEARQSAAAAREQTRRDLYNRFPERFLYGYKTCEEFDLAHPGASILKRNPYPMPWERYQ